MAREVTGNTGGLSPRERREVERLFSRSVPRSVGVTTELARELLELSELLKRRVAILVSREGEVVEVVLGTHELVYLPPLGRYRLGQGRLRRLRLIISGRRERSSRHEEPPRNEAKGRGPRGADDERRLQSDLYADLEKLRLDMVIEVHRTKAGVGALIAHLIPTEDGTQGSRTEFIPDLGRWNVDVEDLFLSLEGEFARIFERATKTGAVGAILVGVYESGQAAAESSMDELRELARTASVHVVDTVIQRRRPDPRTVVGSGKLEEIVLRALRLGAELIIFDTELKPSQWRVITRSTELKVLDRSMLILDIFAARASSSDGRLQVELAQLKYNLPRLTEEDSGLSRLSGGIGGRGPGETKLELGRRRIRERISQLERRIEKLADERALRRQQRQSSGAPLVAIIGYTNAGKSTLSNALTKSSVLAEDKLFATLDPAHRRLRFPYRNLHAGEASIILSDTVGFIRDLPSELRNAFRATLEELYEATLLLHVIDASHPEWMQHRRSVEQILSQMNLLDVERLIVLNKVDAIPATESDSELAISHPSDNEVRISAKSGTGLALLLEVIKERVFESRE